jgi:hypothetical protein
MLSYEEACRRSFRIFRADEYKPGGAVALKRAAILLFSPMGSGVGLPIQLQDRGNVGEGCGTDLHEFSGAAVATARS